MLRNYVSFVRKKIHVYANPSLLSYYELKIICFINIFSFNLQSFVHFAKVNFLLEFLIFEQFSSMSACINLIINFNYQLCVVYLIYLRKVFYIKIY